MNRAISTFIISAKPQIKVDRFTKMSQILKGGQALKLNAQISGLPKPTVQWFLNEQSVDEIPSVLVQKADGSSSLEVLRVEPKQGGTYRLVAENELGSDSAEFEVKVKDKPSEPINVRCVERRKDHVMLAWEKPGSDGGSPITGYVIEKREASRMTWAGERITLLHMYMVGFNKCNILYFYSFSRLWQRFQ